MTTCATVVLVFYKRGLVRFDVCLKEDTAYVSRVHQSVCYIAGQPVTNVRHSDIGRRF